MTKSACVQEVQPIAAVTTWAWGLSHHHSWLQRCWNMGKGHLSLNALDFLDIWRYSHPTCTGCFSIALLSPTVSVTVIPIWKLLSVLMKWWCIAKGRTLVNGSLGLGLRPSVNTAAKSCKHHGELLSSTHFHGRAQSWPAQKQSLPQQEGKAGVSAGSNGTAHSDHLPAFSVPCAPLRTKSLVSQKSYSHQEMCRLWLK